MSLSSIAAPYRSIESAPALADLDPLLFTLTRELAASAAEVDRSGAFPAANFALLQRHGLLALTVPRELGGAGADLAAADGGRDHQDGGAGRPGGGRRGRVRPAR